MTTSAPSARIFIAKLLACAAAGTSDNQYLAHLDYFTIKLRDIDQIAADYYENGAAIPPLAQLVFNFEDLLDNVYSRAKRDAKLELLMFLDDQKTNNVKDINSEKINNCENDVNIDNNNGFFSRIIGGDHDAVDIADTNVAIDSCNVAPTEISIIDLDI